MWPNSQFPADLVTFTKEFLNGELHFLCSGNVGIYQRSHSMETFNTKEIKEFMEKIHLLSK